MYIWLFLFFKSVKLVQDQFFCEYLTILVKLILKMLNKLCLVFFSEVIKNFENSKKIRTSRPVYEKNAQRDFRGFMVTHKFCIPSDKKHKSIQI